MPTGRTTSLDLALPVEGELDGTWGDEVNNGITDYVDIAVAGTLTLSGDGAVTLTKTQGSSSGTNIGATTAQYAIVRITGALTTTKVITAPSVSKTYVIDNAATGGAVTFKASGQTGVSVAVGEKCTVYFNGTDFVKVATSTAGFGDVVGPASSTDNAFARFDSTTGKLLQNSTGATLNDTGAPSFTGSVTVAGTSSSGAAVVLAEDTDNGTNTVTLSAASNIASSFELKLPNADGSTGQAIVTDGSGNLSFGNAGISTGKSIAMAMIFGF